MSVHQDIVERQLNKWRNLRAWGRPLDVELTISNRSYPKRAGTYWIAENRITIYHQPGLKGLVGMLKTGLHEFAHSIESGDGHGFKWQKTYARAVTEITGEYVRWGVEPFTRMDEDCYKAMLTWWRRSGSETSAKRLLGL